MNNMKQTSRMNVGIWHRLLAEDLIIGKFPVDTNKYYDDESEIFVVKIFQNDLEYVEENYMQICETYVQKSCFLVAAYYSSVKIFNETMLDFIINKFQLFKHDDNNDLLLKAMETSSLPVTKYL